MKGCLSRVKNRGDIPNEILKYFFINKPKQGRVYLLPKIHKRLHNVPGRPVFSNSGFFTENISGFLEYHLKPLSQKFKSFIKDTDYFLKKLSGLRDLPDDFILCTVDIVGFTQIFHTKRGWRLYGWHLISKKTKPLRRTV